MGAPNIWAMGGDELKDLLLQGSFHLFSNCLQSERMRAAGLSSDRATVAAMQLFFRLKQEGLQRYAMDSLV